MATVVTDGANHTLPFRLENAAVERPAEYCEGLTLVRRSPSGRARCGLGREFASKSRAGAGRLPGAGAGLLEGGLRYLARCPFQIMQGLAPRPKTMTASPTRSAPCPLPLHDRKCSAGYTASPPSSCPASPRPFLAPDAVDEIRPWSRTACTKLGLAWPAVPHGARGTPSSILHLDYPFNVIHCPCLRFVDWDAADIGDLHGGYWRG